MRFVAVDDLKPGMELARRIIDKKKNSLLEKGMFLTGQYIDRLKNDGYIGAYIVDTFTDEVQIAEHISNETHEKAIDAVSDGNIGNIMRAGAQIVNDISRLGHISVDVMDVRSFDDYSAHHSVNVAIYAVAVATKMNLSYDQKLEIAVAALCHDLARTRADLDGVSGMGDEFFGEYTPPKYDFAKIFADVEVTPAIRQAVIDHLRNTTGMGSPFKRMVDETPLYSNIIHAVDTYDELTSRRPYKEPYAPVAALEYMMGGVDILFDSKVVETMQAVIPAYPPGMEVGLSNGETAIVIAHSKQALRPKIKIFGSGEDVDLSTDRNYRMVFITASGIAMRKTGDNGEVDVDDIADEKPVKKDILIVDDNRISLVQTKAVLEEKYNVVALESGLACMKYFQAKGSPDLLIMDIDMPVMDGVSTVEKLMAKGYTALRVIFLTAIANKDTVMYCNQVGALDYLLKPVNPVYLSERVEHALSKSLEELK